MTMTQEQFEEASQWCLDLVVGDPDGPAWWLSYLIEDENVREGPRLANAMQKFRDAHGQQKLEVFMFYAFYPAPYAGLTQAQVWKMYTQFAHKDQQ